MIVRAALSLALAAALAMAAPACSTSTCTGRPPAPAATGITAQELTRLGEENGIHHLGEVAPGLLRGAQPEGDAAFALLAGLGVKTVLSVDGSRPDAEGAARHGIRTVHLPMEYSAIPREEQVKIAAVVRGLPGGTFIHCHHGKHRGPAACAVAWMARDGATPEEARAMMLGAGTDPAYEGLYRDVAAFRPIPAEETARVRDGDLPSAAKVPDLVEAMVNVDAAFGRMKAVKAAAWKTPPSMPDVQPAHEARIIAEHFRETARLPEAREKPADFQGWLGDAEKAAWDLEKAIQAGDGGAAGKSMERVNASCASCHAQYRNRAR